MTNPKAIRKKAKEEAFIGLNKVRYVLLRCMMMNCSYNLLQILFFFTTFELPTKEIFMRTTLIIALLVLTSVSYAQNSRSAAVETANKNNFTFSDNVKQISAKVLNAISQKDAKLASCYFLEDGDIDLYLKLFDKTEAKQKAEVSNEIAKSRIVNAVEDGKANFNKILSNGTNPSLIQTKRLPHENNGIDAVQLTYSVSTNKKEQIFEVVLIEFYGDYKIVSILLTS